jgi:hypothetical protein
LIKETGRGVVYQWFRMPSGLPRYSAADEIFLALAMLSQVSPADAVYRDPVAQKSVVAGSEMAGGGIEVGLFWPHRE